MRPSRWQALISIAGGAALVVYAARGLDTSAVARAVAGARTADLAVAFVLMLGAYAMRGVRWRVWNRALPLGDASRAVLIGYMGNNVLPARLGELVRADWIAARAPGVTGRAAALASIAAERAFDAGVLAALAIGVLAWGVSAGPLGNAVLVFALVLLLVFVLLLAMLATRAHVGRLLDAVHARFPGHLTRIARQEAGFALDGLAPLGTRSAAATALAASVVIWSLEVASYWMLAHTLAPIGLTTAGMLVAVVNFASLFPFTAGGLGAIETAAPAFLAANGVAAHQAFALVLVQHALQLLFTTAAGASVYLAGRRRTATAASGTESPDPAPLLAATRRNLEALADDVHLDAPVPRDVALSIVIPAYNEQGRLPRTALAAMRWCAEHLDTYEVIIVDDGSSDGTLAVADLLQSADRSVRALSCPHRGKGAAVRMGMLNARGTHVLFMDADGATPMSEIPKLVEALRQGHDVAIGSRVLQAPGEAVVETKLHRRIIGRCFALFVNVFAISGIADTQCGFKMFRREVTRRLFTAQQLDGFAFDVEILFLARAMGCSIAEVPVNWQHQPGSKVNLVTDSARMLWDLSHIRWMHSRRQMAPGGQTFGAVPAALAPESRATRTTART